MPKPHVYVETTIPNFYYDFRDSPAITARREATRRWWSTAAGRYELVTSTVVLDELLKGTSNLVAPRLELILEVPLVPVVPIVATAVATYLEHRLMPAKPPKPKDAMHLAVASMHGCDLIVSWNCRHLANPNKAVHIRRINERPGLAVPRLLTPLDLLEGEP